MSDRNGHPSRTAHDRITGCAGPGVCIFGVQPCAYCQQQYAADRERRKREQAPLDSVHRTQDSAHIRSEGTSSPQSSELLSPGGELLSPGDAPVPEYLRAVWEAAAHAPPPPIASRYYLAGLRKLVTLCYALQLAAGDATWFLACRHAAALIGAEYHAVSRWLGKLEKDGVLLRISTGWKPVRGEPPPEENRRANEYRYLGGSQS